jgi:glycosyltransferase involved in cell wall biosynthesis
MNSSKEKLLTVCVSTFNRADKLAKNLLNWFDLNNHKNTEVELIVCDNCSTDNTNTICSDFLSRNKFTYIRNKINVGILGNLEICAERANGKFVWIIGDDDLVKPNAIELVIEIIKKHSDIPLIYVNYSYIEELCKTTDNPKRNAKEVYVSSGQRDGLYAITNLCTNNENFFTGIYTCIFENKHAKKAFVCQNNALPFLDLKTSAPSSFYVLNNLMDSYGYWVSMPQITIDLDVSWKAFIPIWVLKIVPEMHDLAISKGASAKEVSFWREYHVKFIYQNLKRLLADGNSENSKVFDLSRLINQHKKSQSFKRVKKKIILYYIINWILRRPCAGVKPWKVFSYDT